MQLNKNRNNFTNVINSTISELSNIIDVNTVMGSPIILENGDCIIPFSKVTFGILSGGGEYGKINLFSKNNALPHSVGNGSIVSIKPCGFLVKSNSDDSYKILSSNQTEFEKIFNKFTDFLENSEIN